jgi:hypothetical protein
MKPVMVAWQRDKGWSDFRLQTEILRSEMLMPSVKTHAENPVISSPGKHDDLFIGCGT